MTEVDLFRNSHLIDPGLHIWGWEVPVYLFLGGVTAGAMILSGLLALRGGERSRWARTMPFAAPVLLSLGMLALFLDLEHKLHVYRFYLAFQWRSPMSWGAWILMAIYPATLLLGLAALTGDELARLSGLVPVRVLRLGGALGRLRAIGRRHEQSLSKASIILGVLLGGYTGILLGTLGARALWGSTMLGPLFLISGLSTGAALMMLFPLTKDEHRYVQRWDLAAIAAEVVLLALFFMGLVTSGGEAGRGAALLFWGGKYTAPFWTFVIIGGLVVPFLLEAMEARRHLRPTLVAPALILVGGLALRFVLVAAGQS